MDIKKLLEKERRFCCEYLTDRNGTKAAIRAGYAPGKKNSAAAATAVRLLKKPEVLEYIAKRESEIIKELNITAKTVVDGLFKVYQRCLETTPVLEWNSDSRTYEPTGTYNFNAAGAVKALDLLAKHLGMYTQQPTDGNTVTISFLDGIEKYGK